MESLLIISSGQLWLKYDYSLEYFREKFYFSKLIKGLIGYDVYS